MAEEVTDPRFITELETRLAAKKVTDPKMIKDLESRLPQSDISQEMVAGIPIIGPAFDKAVAGANSVIRGTSYGEELARQQYKHEQYGKENPITATGSHIAGNLLVPIQPTGAVAPFVGLAGPLAQRVVAGGGTGATVGAADAALRGEDPTRGAIVGGGAGAAAPVLGEAVGAGYRYLRDTKLGGELADLGYRARQMLGKAFSDATPQSLAAARDTMGPHAFVGELTPGAQSLTQGMAGQADPAAAQIRDTFNQRFAGQPQRIEQAVTQNLGGRTNIPQELDQIIKDRSAAARPLYQAAFSKPVPFDQRLQELIQNPDINAGIMRGVKDAQTEALAKGVPFNPNGWEFLQHGKIGLDRMISDSPALTDQLTGRLTNAGRVTSMLRDSYVKRLDDLNPEYAVARKAWEGPTKVIGAVKEGQLALGRAIDHNDIAQDVSRLNASELDGYRLGMRNSIAVLMDNARGGDTQARNLLLSQGGKAKIAAVFGQNEADRLSQSLQHEVNIAARTGMVVPNWATGASNVTREEARALANPPSAFGEYVKNATAAQPQSLLGSSFTPRAAVDAWSANANAEARQQLAPLLTKSANDDPLLRALVAAKERQAGLDKAKLGVGTLTTRAGAATGREYGKKYVH